MKILIVEDDPAIARMLRRGLTQAEYQVDWAEDGTRGLALARESLYSLIILDVMLRAGMAGRSARSCARTAAGFPS